MSLSIVRPGRRLAAPRAPTATATPLALTVALVGLGALACRAPAPPGQTSQTGSTGQTAQPAQPSRTTTTGDTGEDHAARARRALVGSRAPSGVLDLLDGSAVSLDGVIGRRPIYLKFWATWCVPCREQMPHLESAYRTYGDRVAVYAVDLGVNDPIDDVRAFQAAHHLTVPIALDRDGSLAERFDVQVTPQHILIDRDGIVRYVGHDDMAAINAALEALAGASPAPSASPPPPPAGASPGRGDQPTLSLDLQGGGRFALADHAGAPIALTFVSAWCDGYLAKSRPAMSEACIAHEQQVVQQSRAHPGLTWVAIVHPVWTSGPSVDKYRQRIGLATPIGIDDRAAWFHRFSVRSVPTTILLDAHGTELARVTGRGDDLAAALSRLP